MDEAVDEGAARRARMRQRTSKRSWRPWQEVMPVARKDVLPTVEGALDDALPAHARHSAQRYTVEALAETLREIGTPCSPTTLKSMKRGHNTKKEVVEAVADLLGVTVWSLVDDRALDESRKKTVRNLAWDRMKAGLAVWPVPLAEAPPETLLSWMMDCDRLEGPSAAPEVLTLERGLLLDRWVGQVALIRSMGEESQFARITAMIDLLNDVRAEGLHLLAGRFVATAYYDRDREMAEAGHDPEFVRPVKVLLLRFDMKARDPGYTHDRSNEVPGDTLIAALDGGSPREAWEWAKQMEEWNGGPIGQIFDLKPAHPSSYRKRRPR